MMLNLFFLLSLCSYIRLESNGVNRESLDIAIKKGQENIVSRVFDGNYWNYGSVLGIHFIGAYSVILHLVDRTNKTMMNLQTLKEKIYSTQKEDGSWMNVEDSGKTSGELDTSIMTYWFEKKHFLKYPIIRTLKVLGENLNSTRMTKAKNIILSKGGIEKAQLMTQIWLSLFDGFDWEEITYIPLTIFSDWFPYKIEKHVSQWVFSHIPGIAYLRYFKFSKNLGDKFKLKELFVNPKNIKDTYISEKSSSEDGLNNVVDTILKLVQPHGSVGAYTVSTLFSLISLNHFIENNPHDKRIEIIQKVIVNGYSYIEEMYFKTGVREKCDYKGVLDDGRYWESILSTSALIMSDYQDKSLIQRSASFLASKQVSNGGIPYGIDFEYAPDIDDTAELVTMYELSKEQTIMSKRAKQWVLDMQNSNGGWAAFAKDVEGNAILKKLMGKFENSAELFDPSCVDIVGHVLEALGESGEKFTHPQVQKGIEFSKKQQKAFGGFQGRWGNNYLYATSALVVGLSRVGYNMSSKENEWIHKGISWMASKQNSDGGFGETALSYFDDKYAGVGASTSSQTAWVALAFIEYERSQHSKEFSVPLAKAINFLIEMIAKNGFWFDVSTVGTGHRGILMMNYLAYPYSFPLMACGKYRKLI